MTTVFSYQELKQLDSVISPFAAKDEGRPLLCCMHVVFDGVTLTAEATDSYKAGRFTFHHPPSGDPFDALINVPFLRSFLRAVRYRSAPVFAEFDMGKTAFTSDTLSMQLLDVPMTEFPKLGTSIFPDPAPTDEVDLSKPTGALALSHMKHLIHLNEQANVTITRTDPLKATMFDVQHTDYHGQVAVMPVRRPS